MRTNIIRPGAALATAALLLFFTTTARAQTPQVGEKFPPFAGKTYDGQPVALADYAGKKAILIDFWATWCGPCIRELPNVKRAYAMYHDKGFEVVGISLDRSIDALRAFQENPQTALPWKSTVDGKGWQTELAGRYGIQAIPATFLLDASGTVVATDLRGTALMREVAKLVDPDNVPDDVVTAMNRLEQAATDADRAEAMRRLKTAAESAQEEVNAIAWEYLDSDTAEPGRAALFLELMAPTVQEGKDGSAIDTAALAAFIKGDAAEALRLQRLAMALLRDQLGDRFEQIVTGNPDVIEMRLREACYALATGDGDAARQLMESCANGVQKNDLESSRYWRYLAERMKATP